MLISSKYITYAPRKYNLFQISLKQVKVKVGFAKALV